MNGLSRSRIALVARHTLSEMRHRRLLWVAAGLALGLALLGFAMLQLAGAATAAGETPEARELLVFASISGIVAAGSSAANLVVLVAGAGWLWQEAKAGTLVALISRPLRRTELLLGKALGISIAGLALKLIALGVAAVLAVVVDAQIGWMFALGTLHAVVRGFLFACVVTSIACVVVRPVGAGVAALLLYGLPALTSSVPVLGTVARYLAPAVLPPTFEKALFSPPTLLQPDYGLFAATLLENLLYAVTALLLASVYFSRRDLPVRL